MKFEHLIEINDLSNPAIPVITREQLWRGLVLRADSPKLFISYLDESLISERNEVSMQRQLRYGALVVMDHVHFEHLDHVHYHVPAQNEIPQSSLRMTIEEPEANSLFVRFYYDDGNSAALDEESKMVNEYRRSAYQEADIETIRIIRELAQSGRLDVSPS